VGQLGAALKARGRMLVILDDLQGPAPYLQAWLAGAPETCFLVTGRSRLELAAAQSLPLAPLPTSEGLELLQHRVRALGLEHGDDLEENRTATALVEKLDGLPLAIELAAGRLKLLGVSELLERLDERFEVLRGRAPGIDPRKSTLRGVLQASWTQLSPWEQLGLAQCSVFPASFTLAAAEAVVAVAAWAAAPWALDVLQSLQDRSLLQVEAPEGGRTRFRLLHSIRDYAAEQLLDSAAVLGPNGAPATGPSALAAARSRHCSHYAVLGSPGRLAALDAPGALEPVRRLLRERDNLLTALDSAIEQGSSQLAANAAAALQEVARLRGPLDRVDARIDRILVLADLPLEERVRLATRRSDLRVWAGRVAEARADLQELRATVEPLQRAELEAPILDALGRLEVEAGDLRAARPVLEAALLAARSCGASEVEALAQMSLGSVHQSEGRVDLAEDCFRAALETMQACGNSRYAGVLLLYLGSLDMERGRLESARLTFEGALASTREVGARRHEASALGNLGTVFLELGQLERARELTEAALAAHREVGTRRLESVTLGNLGTLCMALGKPDEAQVHYRQSIALQEELGNRGLAAIMRGNLAELHLLAGRLQEAEEALTQALSTCVDLGMEAPEGVFLAMLGELRSLSGDPEGADEALDRGEQLLRKTRRRTELGKLLCRKGRIAVKRGEREAAAAALAEASGLAAETQVTEDSDLGRAVQALRDALEAKAAT